MNSSETFDAWRHLKIAAIWIGLAAASFILWVVRDGILIAFAAVLAALMLRSLGRLVARATGLGVQPSVGLAMFFVFGVAAAALYLFGTETANEINGIAQRVQQSETALSGLDGGGLLSRAGSSIASAVPTLMSAAASLWLSASEAGIVIIVAAIYLALQPGLYRTGLLMLLNRRSQEKVAEALDVIERSLVLWLGGQVMIMVAVGLMTFAALWLIDLPSAAGLALIAGVSESVPYVGPFVAAVPAILVAVTQGLDPVLWTIGIYIGVHLVEGYLLSPLIQRRLIFVPPALVLISLVMAEMVFGYGGLLLAAPLTITVFIAVKALYVRDALHRPTDIPGDGEKPDQSRE